MLEQNPLPKTLQTICVSEFQIVHIFKVCYIFIVLYNILHAQQGLGQYPIIDHNISTAKYMKTDPTLEKDYKQLQLSPGVLSCNKLQKKKVNSCFYFQSILDTLLFISAAIIQIGTPVTSFLSIRERSSSIPALSPGSFQSRLYKPPKGICCFYYFTPLPETLQ